MFSSSRALSLSQPVAPKPTASMASSEQRHGVFVFGVPKMRKRIHGKQSVPANILYSPERAMKLPTIEPACRTDALTALSLESRAT